MYREEQFLMEVGIEFHVAGELVAAGEMMSVEVAL